MHLKIEFSYQVHAANCQDNEIKIEFNATNRIEIYTDCKRNPRLNKETSQKQYVLNCNDGEQLGVFKGEITLLEKCIIFPNNYII